MSCVLGEASPTALKFAPHLARRHAMEASPRLAPSHSPPTLGLGGRGGNTNPPSGRKRQEDDQ
jgi:hypothetical protein